MKFNLSAQKSFKALIAELATGLRRLDFGNNFESFEVTITVNDQTQTPGDYKIRNKLDPHIPSGMLIVKQTGNALVTAGTTDWDSEFVYVRNHSTTTDSTLTIKFFK